MSYLFTHFHSELLLSDLAFYSGPDPGEEMPDFDLLDTDGNHVRKSDFVGHRPLLITFGSITGPMTRTAIPVLKSLYEQFGDRVAFMTLYVREAHPGERFPQPSSFDQKLEYARRFMDDEQIPWTVAVDSLEGELHRKLDPKTNAAYIMNTDGVVAFRSLWSNDEPVLMEGLSAIAADPKSVIGERETRTVPLLKGLGQMSDTLDLVGGYAKSDFLFAAPPAYALSWMASLFRPLSPLTRGVAAVSVCASGCMAIGMCCWMKCRRMASRC